MQPVEVVECRTVDEFLSELRLTNPSWSISRKDTTQWVFRGHGDADWTLSPSLWRPRAYESYFAMFQKLQTQFNNDLVSWIRANTIQPPSPLRPEDELEFQKRLRYVPCGVQAIC